MKGWIDVLLIAWIGVAFLFFVVAFGRLFYQAWRKETRWKAIWRVINVQPNRDAEWPNSAPKFKLIIAGRADEFDYFWWRADLPGDCLQPTIVI